MNGWNNEQAAKANKEAKENINNIEKTAAKYQRQVMKLQCLEAAIRVSHKLDANGANDRMSDKEIVMAAKEFYAFVRT